MQHDAPLNLWNLNTRQTLQVADIFAASGITRLTNRAESMRQCARFVVTLPDGHLRPILVCGDRFCAGCEGRIHRITRPYQAGLPALLDDAAGYDFHHVTLTLNRRRKHGEDAPRATVPGDRLRAAITKIGDGCTALFKGLKYRIPALGYFRKLEVSTDDGLANPHVHALLAAPAGTMDTNSLDHQWQSATNLRYRPDVHVTSYTAGQHDTDIANTLGYLRKPVVKITPALLANPGLLTSTALALEGVRSIAASQLFRHYRDDDRPMTAPTAHQFDGNVLMWSGNGYTPYTGYSH